MHQTPLVGTPRAEVKTPSIAPAERRSSNFGVKIPILPILKKCSRDPISELESRDLLSEGDDFARSVGGDDEGSGQIRAVFAGHDQQVAKVEGDGLYGNQHLSRAGRRARNLVKA
jgi:hypothetical protein